MRTLKNFENKNQSVALKKTEMRNTQGGFFWPEAIFHFIHLDFGGHGHGARQMV